MENTGFAKMGRREFISLALASAASTLVSGSDVKPGADTGDSVAKNQKTIASGPVLQAASATSMGVAFAVRREVAGWVDVSRSPDMSGSVRVWAQARGLKKLASKIVHVRIKGLRPGHKYYYRIGVDAIDYKGGYDMKNRGSEAPGEIYSFTTLGENLDGAFAVINDTHENKKALDFVFRKIEEISPAVVLWNGDASNTSESIERMMKVFITPHPGHPAYAANTPYLLLRGNHEYRGRANRSLEDAVMLRDEAERKAEFAELGWNFVQRLGDIALIGMDTGEDKLDTNPIFAGIFAMKPYRELQTRWLRDALESPAVKTARFKVVLCHIPLFDPRKGVNPGDLAPADVAEGYSPDYAVWQRTCAEMWGPLFEKAGVQLVVCGHQHAFRYDPADASRPWAQIVGGGPETGGNNPARVPTVVEGRVVDGKLAVKVHDAEHGRLLLECEI